MLRWDSRRASTATVLKRKSKANTEKGNPGKSSLSIYGILLKMTKGTNVKSVWNQNERKQLILTDDHNTFSTTNWVDLTLNRWGQKRTHAKIHPVLLLRHRPLTYQNKKRPIILFRCEGMKVTQVNLTIYLI